MYVLVLIYYFKMVFGVLLAYRNPLENDFI